MISTTTTARGLRVQTDEEFFGSIVRQHAASRERRATRRELEALRAAYEMPQAEWVWAAADRLLGLLEGAWADRWRALEELETMMNEGLANKAAQTEATN